MSGAPPDASGAPARGGGGSGWSSWRLRRTRDFDRVQRGGRRIQGRHLVVLHAPNGLEGPRFGLAVSRKVGNAVVRNRVKRWIRESVRHRMEGVDARDVVLVARASAATAGFAALDEEIGRVLRGLRGANP